MTLRALFTRTAERCVVVQSALSHQVNALEREVGTALFARSTRRVELTAAGEVPVSDGPVLVQYVAWNDFNPSPATLAFLDLLERGVP